MKANCLDPVIDKNCKILILGSMPSVISREKAFYYANPTNRFWKALSFVTDCNFYDLQTEEKKSLLLEKHIALYDVFSSCEIKCSSDSDIKNAKINDIPTLIKNTAIKTIYITSKKAYTAFTEKYGIEVYGAKVIALPSPSSANRSKFKTDEQLLYEWKKLFTL